jgi:hypothetical protein
MTESGPVTKHRFLAGSKHLDVVAFRSTTQGSAGDQELLDAAESAAEHPGRERLRYLENGDGETIGWYLVTVDGKVYDLVWYSGNREGDSVLLGDDDQARELFHDLVAALDAVADPCRLGIRHGWFGRCHGDDAVSGGSADLYEVPDGTLRYVWSSHAGDLDVEVQWTDTVEANAEWNQVLYDPPALGRLDLGAFPTQLKEVPADWVKVASSDGEDVALYTDGEQTEGHLLAGPAAREYLVLPGDDEQAKKVAFARGWTLNGGWTVGRLGDVGHGTRAW